MEEIEISFFKRAASRESVQVTARQIVEGIRTGRWQEEIRAIRKALAEGDKKRADDLKRRLPYVSWGGVFDGGHKANQLKTYSRLVVADYDGIPCEELEHLRDMCMLLPFVMTCFITPSDNGLKVVVVTDGKAENHTRTYAAVTTYLDNYLSYTSDPSCKDISRGHFVSADPGAVYREVTEPFITENLNAAPADSDCKDVPVDFKPVETEEFVRSYLLLYPAREGNRNNQLFRLGCEAHKRGIESDALRRAATRLMASPDFDEQEISLVVKSAYSRKISNEPKKAGSVGPFKVQSPLDCPEKTEEEDNNPPEGDAEELREHTPTFSKEVFDGLPEFLQAGLKHVTGERERDMLLLAMITVISSLLHRVTAYYARKRYWANLYCFVVAAAASNKGIMERALNLCKYYFKEVADANEILEKQYNKEEEEYEQALRQTRQGKNRSTPAPTRPTEPAYCYPQIPADISKARLLIHQRDNKEKGGLMFDLEADTLSSAGSRDYGNFFDFLRKFFQHEPTSASFKVNGKPIYVPCPRLSVMLAGTPAQLCRMIPYSENGLFSRFMLYTLRQQAQWMDVSPGETEDEVEKHFDQLAMRLNQSVKFLDSSSTQVRLTSKQWNKLNRTFGELLKESTLDEREDFQSCVKRHGLMTMRVCMVFTALEKAAMRMPVEEIYCSDTHFETALALVTCCLEHSRLLITSIKSLDKDAGTLQNPYKLKQTFRLLHTTFTTADYMEAARQCGLKPTTAKRLLHKSIGLKINKIKKGVYKMIV